MSVAALMAAAFFLSTPMVRAQSDAGDVQVFVPESLTDISAERTPLSGSNRSGLSDAVATTCKKVVVVGRADVAGVEVDISNNGRSHFAAKTYDGYFHTRIILSLGLNQVDIMWRRPGGEWSKKQLAIFRSSKLEGGVSGNYPQYIFHKGDNEEHCQQCHQMGLTKAEIDTGMEKSCLKCHKDLADNLFVHGPVNVGICTVCHDPDSAPNKYRVEGSDKQLCYGCHTDRKAIDESKTLQHGPVGAGLCTVCHDPHSSPFEFQLIKAKTDICALCHQDDIQRWIGQNSLHPPFKSGNCPGCHDPHSSNFKYNLKTNRKDLCALCHQLPIPGHTHEVGKKPFFDLPADFPTNEDGTTLCLTCHDPHGAKGQHLTRGSGCDGCHNK